MTHYGVMTDYEYSDTHKRQRLTVWSPPFMSTFEAEAFSLPRDQGFMLTTYNGDKVRVECPAPRTEKNYERVDRAISNELVKHYLANGSYQMQEA